MIGRVKEDSRGVGLLNWEGEGGLNHTTFENKSFCIECGWSLNGLMGMAVTIIERSLFLTLTTRIENDVFLRKRRLGT